MCVDAHKSPTTPLLSWYAVRVKLVAPFLIINEREGRICFQEVNKMS